MTDHWSCGQSSHNPDKRASQRPRRVAIVRPSVRAHDRQHAAIGLSGNHLHQTDACLDRLRWTQHHHTKRRSGISLCISNVQSPSSFDVANSSRHIEHFEKSKRRHRTLAAPPAKILAHRLVQPRFIQVTVEAGILRNRSLQQEERVSWNGPKSRDLSKRQPLRKWFAYQFTITCSACCMQQTRDQVVQNISSAGIATKEARVIVLWPMVLKFGNFT